MSENPCSYNVTCAYNCDPTVSTQDCPILLSYNSEQSYSLPVSTNMTIDLWGNILSLHKTNRLLEYDWSVDVDNGDGCSAVSMSGHGSISEDCTYKRTELYYVNQTHQVALYKETLSTLSFSGSGEGFAGLAVGSHAVHYLKVRVGSESSSIDSKIILLKGSTKTVIDSFASSSSGNPNRFFLFPTPAVGEAGGISSDKDLERYGFYNAYESCEEAGPESKSYLDGGRYMYFPEWLRSFVRDPYFEASRGQRFAWCAGSPLDYGTHHAELNLSILPSIPCGSYVKHPKYGEMYNFYVRAVSHGGMLNIKSDNIDTEIMKEINALLPKDKQEELGAQTLYYPISLV